MMKNLSTIIALVALLFTFTIVSCSKEDTSTKPVETDVRDLAVGTYAGLSSFKDTSGSTVQDTATTLVIAKGAGNTLTITEDGATIVTGAIVVAGKDFTGNIPVQSITKDGLSVTIKGRGNNNEHYGFLEAQKAFMFDIEITDGPLKGYSYMVLATKK
jgi:hypothetical protein